MSKTNDHLYLNVDITNTNATAAMQAYFRDVRNQPLLLNPSDYHLSVVRFQIPGSAIPIFIWPHASGVEIQTYRVTLSYSGTDFSQWVVYTPQIPTLLPANEEYWYVTSYQHVISLFNIALAAAYVALTTAYPAAPPTAAPFFIYNAETNLITLAGETLYNNNAGAPATIEIYLNALMYELLEGLQIISYTPTTVTSTKNAYMAMGYRGGNNVTMTDLKGNSNPTLLMEQEYNTLYKWNNVRGIALLSSSIPVADESTSGGTDVNGAPLSYKVLTDFIINSETGPSARSDISYNPTAEFRYVDLVSSTPLRNIDISIYWVSKLGTLYPLFLQPYSSASIKILFKKRNALMA